MTGLIVGSAEEGLCEVLWRQWDSDTHLGVQVCDPVHDAALRLVAFTWQQVTSAARAWKCVRSFGIDGSSSMSPIKSNKTKRWKVWLPYS